MPLSRSVAMASGSSRAVAGLVGVVFVAVGVAGLALGGGVTDELRDARRDGAVAAARSSAVLITATGCFPESIGSGAVIEAGVVTNAHVVAGATEVVVTTTDGESHTAEIRSFDPVLDLALLDLGDVDLPSLPTAAPQGGTDAVVLVRGDDGTDVRAVDVDVVRTINIFIGDIYGDGRHERKGLEVRAEIEPGDSGAAVIGPDGGIVGVVFSASRRSADVGYAISSAELADFAATKSQTPVDPGSCLRGG